MGARKDEASKGTVPIETLRVRCNVSAKLWQRMFAALTLAAFREAGAETLRKLWWELEHEHHKDYFVPGLKKLGIDKLPPAVAAAQYHYLTNVIGGLAMHYMEESPKKVWIRYCAPAWTYVGVALAGVPQGVRRHGTFASWHPYNGVSMGTRRLQWVITKMMDEGDPYDEGYFHEVDRDLKDSELVRSQPTERTPEFDPAKAPKFDPADWPEPRLLKAKRNFSRDYTERTVATLYAMIGTHRTHAVVRHASRTMAVQLVHELQRDLGTAGSDVDAFVRTVAGILDACGQPYALERPSAKAAHFVLDGLLPFKDPADELRDAYFQFFVNAARVLNGHLKVERAPYRRGAEQESWTIEDAGRWLW